MVSIYALFYAYKMCLAGCSLIGRISLDEIGIEPSFGPMQAYHPASPTSIALAIAAVAVSEELHPVALLQLS